MVDTPNASTTSTPSQGFPQLNSPFVTTANGVITPPWYNLLISLWNRSGVSQGGTLVPSGQIMPFAGPLANIPVGWLLCNGTSVSQTTYAALFQSIGTSWGQGPAGTFNLPNFQGKVLIGANSTYTFASTGYLGQSGSAGFLPQYASINYIIKT